MRFWRLSSSKSVTAAFSGTGSLMAGGRWHPRGVAVVYVSSSLSLAALEILVHVDAHQLKTPYHVFSVDVPDTLVETPSLAILPSDWRAPRRSSNARAFGAAWAASCRSLALQLPSVIIPEETNAILNPRHPAFTVLSISTPRIFRFDKRLTEPSTRPAPHLRRRPR